MTGQPLNNLQGLALDLQNEFSRLSSKPWKHAITATKGRRTVATLLLSALGLFALAILVVAFAGMFVDDDVFPRPLLIVVCGTTLTSAILAYIGVALDRRRVRAAGALLKAEEERIRTRGQSARATILHSDFSDFNGGEPAENYSVCLTVDIVFEGFRAPSYRIECHSLVPRRCTGRLRLHNTIPVVVDPDHKDNIRILWDRP
jgi:hypothetical protein